MPELKLPELIVILVILLLLFGGKKLPELSRSLGSSIRELRGNIAGDSKDGKAAKSDSKSEG